LCGRNRLGNIVSIEQERYGKPLGLEASCRVNDGVIGAASCELP